MWVVPLPIRQSLVLRTILVLAILLIPVSGMSQTAKNPADAMRELRLTALTTLASTLHIEPSSDFPKIYGVVMDWPIGEQTVSIVSFCDGNASLYTTSTFGIIGGFAHENVRIAAKDFVKNSDSFFKGSNPTSDFSYPAKDRIKFYLLTFQGVRVIEADRSSVESGKDPYSSLFGAGQVVLTELRSITETK